jgi:signal transduction histidine kinase
VLYRILQEALTNVMKHAGPVEATVTLAIGVDAIQLKVDNAVPSESRSDTAPITTNRTFVRLGRSGKSPITA